MPLLRRRAQPVTTWQPVPGSLTGLTGTPGDMDDDGQTELKTAWRVEFACPSAPAARIRLWTYTVERFRWQDPYYEVGIRYQHVTPDGLDDPFQYTDADPVDKGGYDNVVDAFLAAAEIAQELVTRRDSSLTSRFPFIFGWDGKP
jgi:hypothetical protein